VGLVDLILKSGIGAAIASLPRAFGATETLWPR